MWFQSANLALLLTNALSLSVLLSACALAVPTLLHWNPQSSSALQLRLEQRGYLLAAWVAWALGLQMLSLPFFVFNADSMSASFVGAMCAVGVLQANPWGPWALLLQLSAAFASSQWLLLNHLGNQGRDFPWVRLRHVLLLCLLPLFAANLFVLWRYFAGLQPDIVASCCGSLFSSTAQSLPSHMASLPPRLGMLVFFSGLALALLANAFCALRPKISLPTALATSLLSALALLAGLLGVVSFLSLYVYEHPLHHCPFCILKPEYHFVGYVLYVPLLAGAACGLGVGLVQTLGQRPSLQVASSRLRRRLAAGATVAFAFFLVVALGLLLSSRLVLS